MALARHCIAEPVGSLPLPLDAPFMREASNAAIFYLSSVLIVICVLTCYTKSTVKPSCTSVICHVTMNERCRLDVGGVVTEATAMRATWF